MASRAIVGRPTENRMPRAVAEPEAGPALLPSVCFSIMFCGYGLVSFLPDLVPNYPRAPILGYRFICGLMALEVSRRGVAKILRREWKLTLVDVLAICFWVAYLVRVYYDYLIAHQPTQWPLSDYLAYTVGVSVAAMASMLMVRDLRMIRLAPFLCAGICGLVCLWAAVYGIQKTQSDVYRLVANERLNPILLGHAATTLLITIAWWLVAGTKLTMSAVGDWMAQRVLLSIFWVLMVFATGLGTYALGLSASRSPLLALIIALILLVVMTGRKGLWIIAFIIVVLYGASTFRLEDRLSNLGVSIGRISRTEELLGFDDRSGRSEIFPEAWAAFKTSPLIGSQLFLEDTLYPHNTILEALMSTGLVGTIPLILVLILAGRKAIVLGWINPLGLWLLLIFTQSVVGAMTSGAIFYDPMFWSTLGLAGGLSMVIAKGRRPSLHRGAVLVQDAATHP